MVLAMQTFFLSLLSHSCFKVSHSAECSFPALPPNSWYFSHPEVLQALSLAQVTAVMFTQHHPYFRHIQRVDFSKISDAVGSCHYAALVKQSSTTNQLPVL